MRKASVLLFYSFLVFFLLSCPRLAIAQATPTPTPVIAFCHGGSTFPAGEVVSGQTINYQTGNYSSGWDPGLRYAYGEAIQPDQTNFCAWGQDYCGLVADFSQGNKLWFLTNISKEISGTRYYCRWNENWLPEPPNLNPETSCTNNCEIAVAVREGVFPRRFFGMDFFQTSWQWLFPRNPPYPVPRLSENSSLDLEILENVFLESALAGVSFNRLAILWCMTQPERDRFFWQDVDSMVNLAAKYDIQTVGYLFFTPYWAVEGVSSPPLKWSRERCIKVGGDPPENFEYRTMMPDLNAWKNFVRAVVQRYGREGTNQIKYWEIWNEPDLSGGWSGSVEDYARLLKAAAEIIRQEDPEAKILLAGISHAGCPGSGEPEEVKARQFVSDLVGLQRLDGQAFELADYLDIVAFHAYKLHSQVVDYIKSFFTLPRFQGKEFWLTEINNRAWCISDVWEEKCGNLGDYQTIRDEFSPFVDLVRGRGVERMGWFNVRKTYWGPGLFDLTGSETHKPENWYQKTPFYDIYEQKTNPGLNKLILKMLLGIWGQTPWPPKIDFNPDELVNGVDFGRLL